MSAHPSSLIAIMSRHASYLRSYLIRHYDRPNALPHFKGFSKAFQLL